MLREEKLDAFLDAFLDGNGKPAEVDTDFWEETPAEETVEKDGFWDAQSVLAVPRRKGTLSRRTWMAIFLILIAIPLVIWFGIRFLGDRQYLVISLVIAVFTILPFFLVFEGRKPKAREIMTIAVLVAIAVAGRAAFFMLPSFKPMAAVSIIAGVSLGAESGFLVGSVSMLASNMLFGQGPWTPWQMLCMGIIGFLAGILFQKGWLKARKLSLCIYGFLSVLCIYGGIMNPASLIIYSNEINWKNLLAIYISGLPVDLVHAVSTCFFLWLISKPMIEKLERIKIKYGLIE